LRGDVLDVLVVHAPSQPADQPLHVRQHELQFVALAADLLVVAFVVLLNAG
jgi:hypothetical protein